MDKAQELIDLPYSHQVAPCDQSEQGHQFGGSHHTHEGEEALQLEHSNKLLVHHPDQHSPEDPPLQPELQHPLKVFLRHPQA
jgi:hypothetical protein